MYPCTLKPSSKSKLSHLYRCRVLHRYSCCMWWVRNCAISMKGLVKACWVALWQKNISTCYVVKCRSLVGSSGQVLQLDVILICMLWSNISKGICNTSKVQHNKNDANQRVERASDHLLYSTFLPVTKTVDIWRDEFVLFLLKPLSTCPSPLSIINPSWNSISMEFLKFGS